MNWRNKKVLVTGAGGFIGSHLAERLVELGANTRAFVHYRSNGSWGWLDQSSVKGEMEVVAGDVQDSNFVYESMKKVDIVFHLAALIGIPFSYVAPDSYVGTNIHGTLNILQAARKWGTERVIHTSTSEVYGSARYVPIDEKHPLQGQSPYSATKIGADKLAESFFLSFNLRLLLSGPLIRSGRGSRPGPSSPPLFPSV